MMNFIKEEADMVAMPSMEGTLKTSSYKKRELENFPNASDHVQENAVIVENPMKKPDKLELQMMAVSALGINGRVSDSIIFSSAEQANFVSSKPAAELHAAATKLQKWYKGYRTRRNVADCAVVVEELWWKALEFAALRRSSVSFFNSNKSETAVSRWARARTRAAKVGKGLLKDVRGQQLALIHWLEAIDPRHRYGNNLHLYYDVWLESESCQPFFYWLDVGEGKEVNLERCPRMNLQRESVKYLGTKEREAYEVVLERGKLIYKRSKMAVNSMEGTKWMFVLSTSRILYVGQKEKGHFHHSSFLAGGATISSGRLVVHDGTLDAIWACSGHYRPTEENFMEFFSFLEEHQVDLTNVKKYPIGDETIPSKAAIHEEQKPESVKETSERSMSSSKQANEPCCEKATVAAYDLRKPMKYKWSTGVGHRTGCVRFKALEQVNLSPRPRVKPPRPSPKVHLSPSLAYLGLVSPRVRVSASN